jgi:hypothetical protein
MAKKEKKDTLELAEKRSLIYWILMSLVIIVLMWSPFQKGLFNGNSYSFERPIYTALIWSSLILLLISIYFFFVWKWKTNRDALTVLVLLLPLTYLISLIQAASQYYATNMVYIQMIYASFFIIGAYFTKNKIGKIGRAHV